MDTPTGFLWRAGSFLLITAWLLGSGWLTLAFAQDVYARWGSWRTAPIPDKRAIKHIVALLAVIGLNLLFLWFAVAWFTQ
jgi:hypothetical protein